MADFLSLSFLGCLTFQTLPVNVDRRRADNVIANQSSFACLAFTYAELLAVFDIEADGVKIGIICRFHGKDSFSYKPNLRL
ncbi:MAG: hypothetical protein WKF90_06295 [Pyrinomonadaceae bacterium]